VGVLGLRGVGGMQGRSYGKVSIELKLSSEELRVSVQEGGNADWLAIKDLLEFMGFEVKVVYPIIERRKSYPTRPRVINFAVQGEHRKTIQRPTAKKLS
jgi:hypothetical protein